MEAVVETMRAEHDPLASHILCLAPLPEVTGYQERKAARDVGALKLAAINSEQRG